MHGPITSILFADADEKRRPRLSIELEADGFAVIPAITDEQARVKARNEQPHALLLGAGDTPTSPLGLLEQFRTGDVRTTGVAPDVAAIVLAQPGELALLRAFDRGADDVVGPEVTYLELRARLGAVMRRLRGDLRGTQAVFGRLAIDRTGRRASYAGRELNLSTLEYKLLERLTAEPARVFAKSELLAEVWGMPDGIQTRCLDAQACRLRRKLAAVGAGHLVVNRRGVGYALTDRSVGDVLTIGQGKGVLRAA